MTLVRREREKANFGVAREHRSPPGIAHYSCTAPSVQKSQRTWNEGS
jgi:hypothetical protein